MIRLLAPLLLVILVLSSCQKDQPAPDVSLNKFSIKELPDVVFEFDASSEPILITNRVLLPVGTELKSLTPEFELSNLGSLLTKQTELSSGISTVDFSHSVFLKTLDSEGEIDHYYQVHIQVEPVTAPVISKMEFILNPSRHTPLAGLLEIELDRTCKLEIKVIGQDDNDLIKQFPEPSTSFSVPVLGLYAKSTNQVVITVTDQNGGISQESLFVKTGIWIQNIPRRYLILEMLRST